MRYFLEISYNGKGYHGWQIQPNANTVQETIENVLTTFFGESISIVGAGRTDAGVHASQMFAHFDTNTVFIENDLIFKLNSFLPTHIAIRNIFKVKADAHARFNAINRTYVYKIALQKNVFTYDNVYYLKSKVNIELMNEAAKILYMYKDFQCFSKSNTDVKTYNCEIRQAEWSVKDNELQFTIKADRFLRNMVRAIVGTLINIGQGKIKVEDLHQIISSKNRSEAGFSVPAQGLYLTEVNYPENIFL